MMNPIDIRRQPILTVLSLLLLIPPAIAAPGTPQEAATLRLSNAPITVEYPQEWRDWAISLASYADAAAADIEQLIGVQLPAGQVRWAPAASGPGSNADGYVEVGASRAGGALVTVMTNVPLLTQDFGAAYALGYGRWLGAYVAARIAMGAPGGNSPWWTEGAALYLTDRLFRDAKSTTPILYGIEGNFTRAAQSRRPVDLAAATLTDSARGKAYATFKLLEGVYGPEVVAAAIGKLVSRPSEDLAAIVDAIGRERAPDPDQLLRDWLEPTVAIDMSLEKVDVRDGGKSLRVRVRRETPIPMPVTIRVTCIGGEVLSETLAIGSGEEQVEFNLPSAPVSVALDPDGLIPDINRSNNRHGFGNAENIRRFFSFDNLFGIGELVFGGEITLDEAGQRREQFNLTVTNRGDRDSGLGVLVSAEWTSRPERIQRAYFINLGAGETRIVEESFAYPNRGTGRARIDARFWNASDVDNLTDKLVSVDPGAVNSYILLRDAPEAPRRARRGIFRTPPTIAETAGTVQPTAKPGTDSGSTFGGSTAAPEGGEGGTHTEPSAFGIRIVSPTAESLPIGDVVVEAQIVGPDGTADRVDFFVNDRSLGTFTQPPYLLRWSFPDAEQVFVIRAVALSGERLASADVVLDKSAIGFSSMVNLVTVHATIKDSQGRIVRDLTAEDLRVIEDGQQQEVVQFDFGEVPVSAAAMLDQSSSMLGAGIRSARAGAERLIDSLVNEVNRAMILGFTNKVFVYADFTHDVEKLKTAIAAIQPDGSTALFDTLAESIRKANRRQGKRALVVLSDGLDTNSSMLFEDVVEYLRQSEVLVYTVGLQLMHDGDEFGDASGAVKAGIVQLRALAEATGGAAYFPISTTELEEIYGLIADELNSQYALSYNPTNRSYNGTWRDLRVDVPGHPEYVVQVRPGYYGLRSADR